MPGARVTGFRIWWADGSTSEGRSLADWKALKGRSGAQIVMLYEDQDVSPGVPYRRVMQGSDFYHCWRGFQFGQTDVPGALPGAAVSGSWLPDAEYEAIVKTAFADLRRP